MTETDREKARERESESERERQRERERDGETEREKIDRERETGTNHCSPGSSNQCFSMHKNTPRLRLGKSGGPVGSERAAEKLSKNCGGGSL